ncbi:unnamed protein product [Boreogadus saida]
MATLRFGQHVIKVSAVFLQTELSFALVNRKPVVPGQSMRHFKAGAMFQMVGHRKDFWSEVIGPGLHAMTPELASGGFLMQGFILFTGPIPTQR